jgi:hypothetical protein
MRSLDRQPRPAFAPLSELALLEQQAWEMERTARYAARPLPTQPAWAGQAARWSR